MRKTKIILRLICLTLTAVLTFSLTGCSGQNDSSFNNDLVYNDNVNTPSDNADNQDSDDYNDTDSADFSFNYSGMPSYDHKTEVPEGYIGIYTVDDLLNSDVNHNENYILMNDLDLSGISNWTGISNEAFFDGNWYTISNLKSDCSGLFTSAENISNLNLVGIEIEAKINHRGNIGGMCNIIRGNISGCYVSGTIDCDYYGEDYHESYAAVGGLVGRQIDGGAISFCKNAVDIFTEAPIGYEVAVGGVVGEGITINDCINYGEVMLETESTNRYDINPYVQIDQGSGGICGQANYGDITIDACRNEGNVYSNNAAGGILGNAKYDTTDSLLITNCSNTGRVLGYPSDSGWPYAAGGIVGASHVFADNKEANLIENCFNSGEVGTAEGYEGISRESYIGAIIGYEGHLGEPEADFTIRNCAYSTSYPETSGIGAMYSSNIALSDDEMKNIDNYNFTDKSFWRNSTSADTPYPFYSRNYF